MTPPVNPIVAELVARLDDNQRESFEERAGIVEFDANQPRVLAECLALLDLLRSDPLALSSVTLLEVSLGGVPVLVLTDDPVTAQAHLAATGGAGIKALELVATIRRLGGMVRLKPLLK